MDDVRGDDIQSFEKEKRRARNILLFGINLLVGEHENIHL